MREQGWVENDLGRIVECWVILTLQPFFFFSASHLCSPSLPQHPAELRHVTISTRSSPCLSVAYPIFCVVLEPSQHPILSSFAWSLIILLLALFLTYKLFVTMSHWIFSCLQQGNTNNSVSLPLVMGSEVDAVKDAQIVDARARNISHNVRCTECGSQSIEDSQADIAILLRKLIRDEIRSGKTDREIYKKLEEEYGETVLYAPKFDLQTAALWLCPLLVAGGAAGVWAYNRHRKKTNVHIMALNLIRGVPLTPKEKETMLDLLTPPPSQNSRTPFWWRRWQG